MQQQVRAPVADHALEVQGEVIGGIDVAIAVDMDVADIAAVVANAVASDVTAAVSDVASIDAAGISFDIVS